MSATPPKNNHLSSNFPTKYDDSTVFDYIMNLSPLRPAATSSSISTHINLLSSSSLSPSLIVHRITSVEELRFITDPCGSSDDPDLNGELVPRRTSRRRCLFSDKAAVSGSKAGDDVEVAGPTRSLSRAVSALAGLNWADKSSMSPSYLNHVISLWRELIPASYAATSSSSSVQEEDELEVPAKKRTKLDPESKTGSCKRCSCRKSRCLKLYCECFGSGIYCTGSCLCQNCLNKPLFRDKILEARSQIESRNPIAFAPTKNHQGCKCKRSTCLKKYCECFQAGVGCSFSCRCEGCRNPLGCKPYSNQESRVFETKQHRDIEASISINASSPQILKSSSPNGKRISLPQTTVRNLYHSTTG